MSFRWASTLALVFTMGLSVHARSSSADAAKPKVFKFPESGQYYTGILRLDPDTEKLQLKTDSGVYPLTEERSTDTEAVRSQFLDELGAFVDKQVTIRGNRYLDNGVARLGVQMYAPGDSKDFIGGRLATDDLGRQFFKVGQRRILLAKRAASHFRQHAQTLDTSIALSDALFMYGKTYQNKNGELEFRPKTYDAWYLMRLHRPGAVRMPSASGREYRLYEMETPATGRAEVYGHLEVPVGISFNDLEVGETRGFVKAQQLDETAKPLFALKHDSIKLRALEFSSSADNYGIESAYVYNKETDSYDMIGRRMGASEVAPGHKPAPKKAAKISKRVR